MGVFLIRLYILHWVVFSVEVHWLVGWLALDIPGYYGSYKETWTKIGSPYRNSMCNLNIETRAELIMTIITAWTHAASVHVLRRAMFPINWPGAVSDQRFVPFRGRLRPEKDTQSAPIGDPEPPPSAAAETNNKYILPSGLSWFFFEPAFPCFSVSRPNLRARGGPPACAHPAC